VTRELTGKDKRSRGNSHREEVPHPGRRPAGGGARARNRETLPAGARGARSPAGGTGRGTEDSTADSRVEEEGRVLGREGGREARNGETQARQRRFIDRQAARIRQRSRGRLSRCFFSFLITCVGPA
jgi:hypothetical protein